MATSSLYLFFFLSLCLCIISEAKPTPPHCITNPSFNDTNKFTKFFDKCFIDSSEINILGQMAKQLQMWFNEQTYPVYIVVSLLVLLFCVVKDSRGNDDMARYNFIRLQGMFLLMRIGLAISMTPWLYSAIQQQRPCYCSVDGGSPQPLGDETWWGMPSGLAFASTVLAAHFMTTLNIPFGILCIIVMGATSIVSGQYSFGQTIVGIVFGLVLHIYSIRTPIFMRIIDFIISLVAGFIAIAFAMHKYHNNDFSFSIAFLAGLAWQVYAFTLLFVAFEWGFMRKSMTQSVHSMHGVDFLYFRPLTSSSSAVQSIDLEAPTYSVECYWTIFLTFVLFLVLCGLRVLAPYLNNFALPLFP
eukprot:Phypoly_transcript_12378.p1 GENE.Phypoly_transcript_12378~~Phypoly_transcript_12378.p1  ORF type:complete len:357 (+),score=32.31 Phypoly_transcript_12378:60-1130(+)